MTRISYVCPYCGANDSTRCEKLPPQDERGYTEPQLQRAAEIGCRVEYYFRMKQALNRWP